MQCIAVGTGRLCGIDSFHVLALNRFEKTKDVLDFAIAKKYLKVCNESKDNCSVCPKCKRTMLSLYAIGKLEGFSEVFNLEYFEENKEEYLHWLFKRHRMGDEWIRQFYHLYNDYPQMKEYMVTDPV